MNERTPTDGKPYYCSLCGCGFGEYLACEMPDCKLESERQAKLRQKKATAPQGEGEAMNGANHPVAEAFRQGQRDREQGWPMLAAAWGFEGWALHAYVQGYEHPRVRR